MLKEVPILGSVSYGRHFADLQGYNILDFRSLPYGEDVIEKLLECDEKPLMGRGDQIRLPVRMPGKEGISFYTRRQICEMLPSRKLILAEASGILERNDNGSFEFVVGDNRIWIGRCEESAVIQNKLTRLLGNVKMTALTPGIGGHQHAFIRVEKANGAFGDIADLVQLEAEETAGIIRALRTKRPSAGD